MHYRQITDNIFTVEGFLTRAECQQMMVLSESIGYEATAEFSAEGQPGYHIQYQAPAEGEASDEILLELIIHTDKVAEIQNTLRAGVTVTLL